MTEKSRFDQVRDEMAERKKQAMARSSDLKTEVEKAINELKKRDLTDQEKTELIKRFSEVTHIAGIDENEIQELIQGFSSFDARYQPEQAIDNLKRILQAKHAETREFENQSRHK